MSTTGRMPRRTKKAVEKINKVVEKYVSDGMSEAAAQDRAYREARENPKKDFRRGRKAKKAKKKKDRG